MPFAKITLDGVNTPEIIATPAGKLLNLNVSAVNTSQDRAVVKFYIHAANVAPTDADIFDMATLDKGALLERSGVILPENMAVSAFSDTAAVNAFAWGLEALA
ncbi:hypothetical protein [Phaeobacter inhibens]|uniref:Uncharacterized protein n=1 Tax=Phaeobacter inhibens TaxID=221822 RepID=A0A2I7K9S1_9RHOB|nr:hypothetical protein [Phaeobacter inhibens]AUQ99325.1 hypothetical protein PhaeoP88_01955 [Phaeobacter inhibens]